MKIKFLKANNGDSILISVKENGKAKNILIDGGIGNTYLNYKNEKGKPEDGDLKETVEEIRAKGQKIDLLVLTHVDDDHIGGILRWFEEDLEAHDLIEQVWFNSGKSIAENFDEAPKDDSSLALFRSTDLSTSIGQGIQFEDYLLKHKLWDRQIIRSGMCFKKYGLGFKILSPNEKKLKSLLKKWDREKPDYRTSGIGKPDDYHLSLKEHTKIDTFKQDAAAHNGSSIAFIMEFGDKKWLFLADAHPSVIVESLKALDYEKKNPIEIELVKLSHHGSKANNSIEMLEMIKTNKFVVSTDGNGHHHPNKQMLSRLIKVHPHCHIYFNYGELVNKIFTKEDRCDFPEFEPIGITEEFEYRHDAR